MSEFQTCAKSDEELEKFIEDILRGRTPIDYLHDETPTHSVFQLYQSESAPDQKERITRAITRILSRCIVGEVQALSPALDELLANLAFLAEALKIAEAYRPLRCLLDRGSLCPQGERFFSKDTERKILRSLAAFQPPQLLVETVWQIYWAAEDPHFWDVAFMGLRKSQPGSLARFLQEGYERWKRNDCDFDFLQALWETTSGAATPEKPRDLDFLERLPKSDIAAIRASLRKKGLAPSVETRLFSSSAPLQIDGVQINNTAPFYIYYHRDMDGIAAATLLALYLRGNFGYRLRDINTISVDFDETETWRTQRLQKPAAVVDFLYHEDALVWFEHHRRPFTSDEQRREYERRAQNYHICWDQEATSVSRMLFDRFRDFYRSTYSDTFDKLSQFVDQVDVIDSARYPGVDDWLEGSLEVGKINLVLMYNRTEKFCRDLIKDLTLHDCQEIIARPEFQAKYDEARSRGEQECASVRNILRIRGDIVFYDAAAHNVNFFRFLPYRYYPDAAFVVGIYRKRDWFEVSVGRNPWKRGRSDIGTNIGELCLAFSGGGHKDVGGVTLKTYEKSLEVSHRISAALLRSECVSF